MTSESTSQIERGIIGLLLADPDQTMPFLLGKVDGGTFTDPVCLAIWEEIQAANKNGRWNAAMITSAIHAKGTLRDLGGPAEVSAVMDDALLSAGYLEPQIAILRDRKQRREVIAAARKLAEAANDQKMPIADVASAGQTALLDIMAESIEETGPRHIRHVMEEAVTPIIQDKRPQGMLTGLRELDGITSGFLPKQFVVIAGRPAMGKSAMMAQIAEYAAGSGTPTLYVTVEMSDIEIAQRAAVGSAGVDLQKIRSGGFCRADHARIIETAKRISLSPLYIEDVSGLTIERLKGTARMMHHRHKIGLIVVDYLQLMRGEAKSRDRHIELGEVSRGLKAIAKELGIVVIAGAQINRASEQRAGSEPRLADIRESGSIEQDADTVILLHRPGYYSGDNEDSSAMAIVAKQRGGRTDTANLTWMGNICRFQ